MQGYLGRAYLTFVWMIQLSMKIHNLDLVLFQAWGKKGLLNITLKIDTNFKTTWNPACIIFKTNYIITTSNATPHFSWCSWIPNKNRNNKLSHLFSSLPWDSKFYFMSRHIAVGREQSNQWVTHDIHSSLLNARALKNHQSHSKMSKTLKIILKEHCVGFIGI